MVTQLKNKRAKVRKNFRLPADLVAWIETYARRKNTNVTQLIVKHFTELQLRERDAR